MRIHTFSSREEWLDFRMGKLSGSKVKDLLVKRGTGEKLGFYRLIAERISVRGEADDPRNRGLTLEEAGIRRLEEAIGKPLNTDLVVWQDDKYPHIILSPDGFVSPKGKSKKITIAAEIKCLGASKDGENNGRHVEALIKQEVPTDYEEQVKWYFIVNPDLQTLYMGFYDPRCIRDFFYLTVKRTDYAEGECEELAASMIEKLDRIEETVAQLIKGTDLEF